MRLQGKASEWQSALRLPLRNGFEPHNAAVVIVREQINEAIRSLHDRADALAVAIEQPLFGAHALTVELEARDQLEAERADEGVALPVGEFVPRVEHQAAGRDPRIPVVDRLLHS